MILIKQKRITKGNTGIYNWFLLLLQASKQFKSYGDKNDLWPFWRKKIKSLTVKKKSLKWTIVIFWQFTYVKMNNIYTEEINLDHHDPLLRKRPKTNCFLSILLYLSNQLSLLVLPSINLNIKQISFHSII